jgi:hypothetical protein
MDTNARNGIVSVRGRQSVDAIVEKDKAGLQIPNTKLLIFGNPTGGTICGSGTVFPRNLRRNWR